MAQTHEAEDSAEIPELNEATLGDVTQPSTTKCAPGRGEGALPRVDAVIPDTTLYSSYPEQKIYDLYTVDSANGKRSVPFVHGVELEGPKGEIVRMRSVFDDGAMVNAIDAAMFTQISSRLTPLQPSNRILRMADGRLVPSAGIWVGNVRISNVRREGTFEVFESGGAWALLFGKPLLEAFEATHDYKHDVVRIPSPSGWTELENHHTNVKGVAAALLVGLTTDIKQRASFRGDHRASPSRQVLPTILEEAETQVNEIENTTPGETHKMIQKRPGRRHRRQLALQWKRREWAQMDHEGNDHPPSRQVHNVILAPVIEWNDQQVLPTVDEENAAEEDEWVDVEAEHPRTQEGEPRRTMAEREAWRTSMGQPKKLTKAEKTRKKKARQARLGNARIAGERNMRANSVGDSQPPSREVPPKLKHTENPLLTDKEIPRTPPKKFEEHKFEEPEVWTVETKSEDGSTHPGTEQPLMTTNLKQSILTRKTDPFNNERVDAVLAEITLGPDLTEDQRSMVTNLLRDYADCFALSIGEVLAVEGAEHKLNIPNRETAKFRTRAHQRPLNGPQKEYFNTVINGMLEADIIAPISHKDVKCCGATTLAKKAHEGGGLTIEELQHRLNDECVAAGYPPAFEGLPPRDVQHATSEDSSTEKPTKWRVCQDFADLNKVTKVPAMPQGDIRTKQQRLSGHRWVSTFDFAAGFYACEIPVEDRPYICFYVEGRGYFCYKRMPFGLTGAPSTFAEMTANALGDLVGTLFELFVDDGGMAGDDFNTKLNNVRTLLDRVREKKLSLSAAKSSFFMTESTFAGARVGPKGIRPDLTKLTAIVDWKTPKDLQNLIAFTGLTGYFRSLVKGYAVMAQPLTDLARSLDVPKGKGKAAYRRAMKGLSLEGIWKPEHDKAFLSLKVALTSEPVLKGPRFDGTPFVVTTDGCKFGFAGMLSQRHTTVLPNGTEVTRMHPVGFCGKRTSKTEEKYKPYLLEFAALKFSLDKFSDIVWGCPVELETDCQALRDNLLNDKLNATHARWRDGVLAHQITDVRHRPGRLNPVADGLSRKYVNLPTVPGDGHEWTVSEDWEVRTGLQNDLFHIGDTAPPENPEHAELQTRFREEPMFLSIVDALLELDRGKSLRDRKRARHRAEGYMIDGGKLWRVADGKTVRAKARVECISQKEATKMAWEIHREKGHFHRDLVKIAIIDKFHSPYLDRSITKAITECGKCKAFGPTHLHSLLEPITRRHPFELMVTDTLSMPRGKGGFTKIGLFVDVYSQRVWGDKLKKAPTGASSAKKFDNICSDFTAPEALMADGGPEFDNKTLRAACAARGTELRIVAAYSPWINGLVESMNGKLLGRLKRLCAPDLGEDEYDKMDLPESWPDHLEAAIEYLNNRIIPHLKFSPNELLLGLVINTNRTPKDATESGPTEDEVAIQMAYVDQQRTDGFATITEHAWKRKATFDKTVMGRAPKEVVFKAGQLVQVYRSDLDYTVQVGRKMEPKWSAPRRVVSRDRNSYKIETLEGLPIGGRFSARRLRRFLPRLGTQLHAAQQIAEGTTARKEEEEDRAPGHEEESNPDEQHITREDGNNTPNDLELLDPTGVD